MHRPGARAEGREIRFVRTRKAFRFLDAARQLVPADRRGDRFLQIGAALLGFDQRRPQPGEKAYLVVDRPGVTDQGILLADFGATEHAANGALEKGNGVVGQPRDRVEYRRDQSRAAAQRREGPQMLCGETRALARKLAQPFGMNTFGGSRIEADRAQSSPLLDQARKGAMTGSAGRLTRPGQPADRCSLFCRQESIQRVRLHREQAAGQLMRDLALGRHHSCGDELIDNEWTGHNETRAPQLVHQRRGNFAGVGRRDGYGQEPREHFATMLGRESDKSEVRAQGIELLIPCLKACRPRGLWA